MSLTHPVCFAPFACHPLLTQSSSAPSYVGNKIAVFSLQSLGCDVAALNTVQFSTSLLRVRDSPNFARTRRHILRYGPDPARIGNHTGYGQWTGSRVSAQEITDLYQGLKQSYLDDFDMMLSGYVPGAPALEAVGQIAQDLKRRAKEKPGSFFWVLDPVMGDNGNLYVAPDVVPVYKSLVHHADLVLPNQFEAEYGPPLSSPTPIPPHNTPRQQKLTLGWSRRLLSDVPITDLPSIGRAIQVLHERYSIPHIVITSVSVPHPDHPVSSLSVVGSSMTSSGRRARAFKIVFPAIDCYFSGTGDMFAALMVVRMREAVNNQHHHQYQGAGSGQGEGVPLMETESWLSDDSVDAVDLPLAKAAEKVLASMHEVLTETAQRIGGAVEKARAGVAAEVDGVETEAAAQEKKMHLLKSKAAELRLVRHLDSLRFPKVEFRATKL